MRYLGGKFKLKTKICEVLEALREPDQTFIDGTCGGANILAGMGGKKVGYDIVPELIYLYKDLQAGWEPPSDVTLDDYLKAKEGLLTDGLRGFIGFGCSFGGKWFAGYAKSEGRNYALNAKRSLARKMKTLGTTRFEIKSLFDISDTGCLIYFDPPYVGTTRPGRRGGFDHSEFWEKVRGLSKTNTVVVSEYEAPEDFECIWESVVRLDMQTSDNKRTERLFKLRPQT